MNDEDRAAVAARVRAERVRRFGTKSGAYKAAQLNAATWDRIEAGQSVKPHKMAAAVRALWPSTGGDWTRIPDDDEPPASRTVEERLADLEQRLAAIEQHLTQRESESSDGQHTTSTTTAVSATADQRVTEARESSRRQPRPAPMPTPSDESPRPAQPCSRALPW